MVTAAAIFAAGWNPAKKTQGTDMFPMPKKTARQTFKNTDRDKLFHG